MTEPYQLNDHQLREVLDTLAHDMRNPLAALVTNLEFAAKLLSDGVADNDLQESVLDSITACAVLRHSIANFDVLLKGNDLTVTMHDVTVAEVAQDVVARLKERAAQAEITVTLEGADVAGHCMLDRRLLALALENLVANSIQHAPRRSKIAVVLREVDDIVEINVCDDGPAIPEDARELALSPEGHTAAGRTELTRYGRSLSLLAARAAASATGAELTVGRHGEGSRMTLKAQMLPR